MRLALTRRPGRRLPILAAAAVAAALAPLAAGAPASAARSAVSASAPIPAPVHHGTLRITGQSRDGALVTASGLAWHAPRLPRGMKLLSFGVAYTWQSCAPSGRRCTTAADSTATPFAARRYRAGHADTGRRLRVTETAAEVVQTKARNFTFRVLRRSVSRLAGVPVRAYRRHQRPVSYFRNGTPERYTASAEEYFQVSVPHYNTADGKPSQQFRVDAGLVAADAGQSRVLHREAGRRPAPGERAHREPGRIDRDPVRLAGRAAARPAGLPAARRAAVLVPAAPG